MLRTLITAFFCSFLCMVIAQNSTGEDFFRSITKAEADSGSLIINQNPEIEKLVGIHIDSNKRNGGIDGFRIQLYLGSNKNAKKEASEVKGKLLSLFPEEKPYVMFEAPFWRVQVGDFRSKNEALELYKRLKKEFPGCYPVPVNNISLTSLK